MPSSHGGGHQSEFNVHTGKKQRKIEASAASERTDSASNGPLSSEESVGGAADHSSAVGNRGGDVLTNDFLNGSPHLPHQANCPFDFSLRLDDPSSLGGEPGREGGSGSASPSSTSCGIDAKRFDCIDRRVPTNGTKHTNNTLRELRRGCRDLRLVGMKARKQVIFDNIRAKEPSKVQRMPHSVLISTDEGELKVVDVGAKVRNATTGKGIALGLETEKGTKIIHFDECGSHAATRSDPAVGGDGLGNAFTGVEVTRGEIHGHGQPGKGKGEVEVTCTLGKKAKVN